jgi:hypothetical protein
MGNMISGGFVADFIQGILNDFDFLRHINEKG